MWPNNCYSYSVSIAFSCKGLNDELITLKTAKLSSLEKGCLISAVKNYTNNLNRDTIFFPFIATPSKEYAFRQVIKNELENLLIFITRDFEEQALKEKESLSKDNFSIADQVKNYIEEHYKEKILLDDIFLLMLLLILQMNASVSLNYLVFHMYVVAPNRASCRRYAADIGRGL